MSVLYHVSAEGGSGRELAHHDDVAAAPLPVLPQSLFASIFGRLSQSEKELALKHQLLPVAWLPDRTLYASVDGKPSEYAKGTTIAQIGRKEFFAAVRRFLGAEILFNATQSLKRGNPVFSAHTRVTGMQASVILLLAIIYCASFLVFNGADMLAFSTLVLGGFFLSVVALRLMCVLDAVEPKPKAAPRLVDEDLPSYSVLVPLFRETRVLGQLVAALTQLNYPALGSKSTKIIAKF